MLSRLFITPIKPRYKLFSGLIKQDIITKRWSGHNAMDIKPSNHHWKLFKNYCHFYFLMYAIPATVVLTIYTATCNPELTEVPEGYEPLHWEYYKHPLTRWIARNVFYPPEVEHEMNMHLAEDQSEYFLLRRITSRADKVMKFYNDHRSYVFRPFYADLFRSARDNEEFLTRAIMASENEFYDAAYDPEVNEVPTEGYFPKESN